MQSNQSPQTISNRTRNASKRHTNPTSQNSTSNRGRPKDIQKLEPYKTQTQFSSEFIDFAHAYLEWKLNENYIWSVDFDKKPHAQLQKIQIIENPIFQELISTWVLNMRNMMEPEVGREFREACIVSYKYYVIGKNLQYAKSELIERVLTRKEFSYLGLHNSSIPHKNRKVRVEILKKFVEAIVEFVYRAAEKVGESRY